MLPVCTGLLDSCSCGDPLSRYSAFSPAMVHRVLYDNLCAHIAAGHGHTSANQLEVSVTVLEMTDTLVLQHVPSFLRSAGCTFL